MINQTKSTFEVVQGYLENGATAGISLVVVGLVVLFFLRTPLKALMSGVLGYRAKLDDYSFSQHKNREIIYENDKVRLTTGMNKKNAGLMILAVLSTLFHPLLFIVFFGKYKYSLLKEKVSKLKDYSIFDDMDCDDKFVNFLNTKSAKINLITDEMMFGAYLTIGAGIYFASVPLATIGLLIISGILIITTALIYNAYMYRINYKYVDFYRAMRLLDTSSLGGNKSLFLLGVLSFASNFSDIAGFSVYIWAVFAFKFIVSITITNILKREDDVNLRHQEIENRDYINIENIASYPNLNSQSRGYKFSTVLQMKFFEVGKIESGKNLIHVDNYAFYPQTINRTDLRKNPLLNKNLSNAVKISFETLDVTKQIMVLGGMGSGKTEMINYIIQQTIESDFVKFQSIAYNDIKGDFSKNFYREGKDTIVNLYDSRAKIWCPFLEMKVNIESGTAFITNLFETISGSEKDFFSASAKQKTAIWLQESFFNTNSNIEAWEMFFKKISDYEIDIKARDDKTQSSILATIQIALEILNIMYYQIVIEKRETFTFDAFVHSTGTQLFFVNNKQYEAKLTPYLNGLTATYINTVMAKDDTKEHLILNVFDEFLTMKIDDSTRKTLLTATRSKGFCNVLMAQYLINDEKLIQDLDSSRYALITFNINDDFTLDKVSKKIAEAEHLATNSSQGQKDKSSASSSAMNSGGGIGGGMAFGLGGVFDAINVFQKEKYQLSYSLGNTKVLIEQQLQSMPKYHHLTFIPSEETKVLSGYDAKRFFRLMTFGYDKLMGNIAKNNDFLAKESGVLYLGYTPQATLSYNNKSFEKWDMRPFYMFNSKKELKAKQIFTNEKEEFLHYMNIKFAGSVEEAKEYIKAHNLEKYDINQMFINVEENHTKVQELIAKYSEQQRYDLMEKFFEIEANDLEAKYEYCKENNLIGCILGIFTFSKEFRESILGLENGEDIKPFDKKEDTDEDFESDFESDFE